MSPRATPVDGAILLWGASQLLSTVTSVDPIESARDLRNLGYWSLFYFTAWGVSAGARLDRLLLCWFVGGTLAALQGVAEATLGFDLLHDPRPTASGFFVGHLPFGHSQAMLFAAALGMSQESRSRDRQARFALLAVLFAAAVVASGGRGPWLALAVTAFVLVLRGATRRMVLALALVAAIQLGVVARQPGGLETFYRSYVVTEDVEGEPVPEETVYSNLWRLSMWREGLRLFALRPVLGTGVESTGALSREFRTPFRDFGVGHLHSNYAEVAMTRGFVGLAALLALGLAFGSCFIAGSSRLPRGTARAAVTAGFGAVLLHAVHGLTYYSVGSTPIQMSFLWVSGLAVGALLLDPRTVPASPLAFGARGFALGVTALAAILVTAPLLAGAPALTLPAAALAVADAVFRARRGTLPAFGGALVLAFLVLDAAAIVLLAPLPGGPARALDVTSAAASVFVTAWIADRAFEAAVALKARRSR